MFIDTVKIKIKSGNGGNGAVSFFRTKTNPKGGPDGGDGGHGGNVIFQGDPHLYTLLDFKHKRHFSAQNGSNGRSRFRTGKCGQDIIIRVPCGTKIVDIARKKVLVDILQPGEQHTILKGGHGGKGNKFFASPVNTTPRHSSPGKAGTELDLLLDLYIIADIGIIGFPNAGKSSFLSSISNARPKIADYPFTTLNPHLGVLTYNYTPVIFADIPGLIKGSSDGLGLGNKFLKHIERTRLLLHITDSSIIKQGKCIEESIQNIQKELENWDSALAGREQINAINKIDLLDSDELLFIKKRLKDKGIDAHFISCIDHTGINELITHIYHKLETIKATALSQK